MGHQKKRVPKLEPVLENYMGPPITYNSTGGKPSRYGGSTAKVAPASETSKPKGLTSLRPSNIFGKLRDRYVKAMNEMSMGGDLASVTGTHGCVASAEYYPGAAEHHRASAAREQEIHALREELAARRRKSEVVGVEDSDDDDDLGVAEHRTPIHRQPKNMR